MYKLMHTVQWDPKI